MFNVVGNNIHYVAIFSHSTRQCRGNLDLCINLSSANNRAIMGTEDFSQRRT